jgi:predicted kinase
VNYQALEDLHSVNFGRKMHQLVDELDAFRRGGWREACAVEAAKTWRPFRLFNLTDTITTAPQYVSVLEGGDVVAVISDATAKLNRLRQQQAAAAQPEQEVVSQSGRRK